MKFNLRPYQRRFCRSMVDSFTGKVNGTPFSKVLGIGATGCGKTIIGTALMEHWIKRIGRNALFLVDSDELVKQTMAKLLAAADIIGDIEKAESRASMNSPAVVGSIQTLQRNPRLNRYRPDHFGLVIADEAHLSMADGWQRVMNYFHDGGAYVSGITATPERGDKRSLMRWWQHVACEIPMAELITAKHLSPITVETVPLEIKIQSAITDDDSEDVAAELEAYYQAIIDAIEKHAANRRKILIFHPSVKASQKFNAELIKRGHASRHVDGTSADRDEILEGFERNRFRILNNCQLLIKGYDCPDLDTIIILRLCKGRTPYVQMVGRGTRLFCPHGCDGWCDHADRKMDMLLLDFLWECAGHDIMGPADLLTDKPEQREALKRKLKKPGPMDLLGADAFVTGEKERDLLEKLKQQVGKRGTRVDAVSFAAMFHQPGLLEYEPQARWETEPPTPAQLNHLAKMGVLPETVKTKGHASALIEICSRQFNEKLAAPFQVAAMIAMGVENSHLIPFAKAKEIIDSSRAARH